LRLRHRSATIEVEIMSTVLMLHFGRRSRFSQALAILSALVLFVPSVLHAQRVTLAMRAADTTTAADAGPVPASQPMQLTLRLALAADRSAALDQLLATQIKPQSPAYHQWLTPQQFAAQFGATDDQIAATTAWLQSQGLSVGSVSPARTRITISGTAGQVQNAFAVTLHRYQLANTLYVANSNQPSLPSEVAPLIAGVSGLNELPAASPLILADPTIATRTRSPNQTQTQTADPYLATASAIDANASPILTFNTTDCSSDFTQSDYDAYHDLFRQANAQGITILATSSCGARGSGSFPASLGEVTALAINPETAPFTPIAPRPAWQSAPGLPADANRYEPDLSTTSIAAFAQTINTIVLQTAARQGNINAILYSLAPTPNLYTQPDATAATEPGTWELATGLGVIDLSTLLKVYPRATGAAQTVTTLAATAYSITVGQSVTFSSTVTPSASGNSGTPTGTITFTSNLGAIGSAAISNGAASLTANLGAGTYTVLANYSGDSNFAASSSTGSTITVKATPGINVTSNISNISGTLAGTNVIVTATVFASASSTVAPTGTVTFLDTYNGNVIQLGTGSLVPNGPTQSVATYSSTNLPAGAHSVYAVYAGDTNFNSVTSTPTALSLADYNVTMVPQTLTVNLGKNGQVVMLVGAVGGFTGTVTFGCTPPANTETNCSFSPTSLNGSGSTTMTVTTTAPVAASAMRRAGLTRPRQNLWNVSSGAVLALLVCCLSPRRRRLIPALLLLLCSVTLVSSVGCTAPPSQSTTPTTPADPGSPLGTQFFTVTTAGTNGVSTVRHNYQYQVTIQ
jgi:trimeric autotransporter adhesin